MRLSDKGLTALLLAGILGVVMAVPGHAHAAPGDILWEAVYSSRPGNDTDRAAALAMDSQGNLLITGSRAGRDGNYDYLTIKYGPYGSTEWVKIFDGSWYDVGRAVAVDPDGDVVAAGASYNPDNPRDTYSGAYYTDYRIVKYDPSGKPVLETTASGYRNDNEPAAAAVDSDGSIFVTGYAKNGSGVYPMYYTVKFAPDGALLWEKPEDWGTESYATGLKLDADGNVVITGYTMNPLTENYDIRTQRISPDGIRTLMDVSYNNQYDDEKAHGLTLDGEGNIIITGETKAEEVPRRLAVDSKGNNVVITSETSADNGVTLTLKYNPKGELLWARRYNESDYKNRGNAVAADKYGRIYVAGSTFKDNQEGDYLLLVYDRDGTLLVARTYDFGGGDNEAEGVALDALGNIVLAGTSRKADQQGAFRTIRVEGYPAPLARQTGLSPEKVLKDGCRITLCTPPAAMVRSVVLTAEKRAGSPVELVADPVALPGDYEYRFFIMGRNTAHHWEAVNGYTDRNFLVLDPAEDPVPPARVKVQVRTKGSRLLYEAQAELDLDSIH